MSLPPKTASKSAKPVQLVVDSTGLKFFGEGEWLEEKHKTRGKRRSWRKLHLALDLVSGQIVCSDLTTDHIGEPTIKALTDRLRALIEVTISPPKNAVLSSGASRNPSIRDRHIAKIKADGRMAEQKSSGYNQRSRIETQIGCWKAVIGPKLKAHSFVNQKIEAKIGVRSINRMTIPTSSSSMQQRRYNLFHHRIIQFIIREFDRMLLGVVFCSYANGRKVISLLAENYSFTAQIPSNTISRQHLHWRDFLSIARG